MGQIHDVLNNEKLVVSNIIITYKIPKPRRYSPPVGLGRAKSGLIYMLKEKCAYEFDDETFQVSEGELVYVPEGSEYTCTHLGKLEDTRYYVLDFSLADFGGKILKLSNKPVKIDVSGFKHIKDMFEKLYTTYNTYEFANHIACKAIVMDMLYLISKCAIVSSMDEAVFNNMRKAIVYIEAHYMEDVSTKHLADMFNMSQSHFRRLFVKAAGYSPVAYRNRIRIHKAHEMLSNGNLSIQEVANKVGFCDVYYFGTMFKKIVGISPGRVRK